MKNYNFAIVFDFELDLKFWNILPAININIHSKCLEFEFLCFGLYISIQKDLIDTETK